MPRHVWSIPILVLALSGGATSGASPQALELASRGPRFIASWTKSGEALDVSSSAVLRRRVSLDLTNVTADEALKEITRQAALEISYSKALLPNSASVSLHAREITVAAALTEVLLDAGVDVAVARGGHMALVRRVASTRVEIPAVDTGAVSGRVTDKATGAPLVGAMVIIEATRHSATTDSDGRYRIAEVATGTYGVRARYIGYAPLVASVSVSAGVEAAADFALVKSVQELEEVVTTGTIVPTEVKALPTPISIVTPEDIQQRNLARIDQLFRGEIPGSIAWDQGTDDYYSTINVRGTNSLYLTPTIKTYIDGIEVADPQWITTIDPNVVERIEVTRGPQASTVYGSDASGGVMQIFTKKGSHSPRPQLSGKAALGVIEGPFSNGSPVRQDYSLAVSGGSSDLTYNVGGSYVRVGEWAPTYFSRTPNLFAGSRVTQGQLTAELTARYSSKSYATVFSPVLSNLSFFSQPAYLDNQLSQQTFGINLSYQATARWQHSLVLGFDRLRTSTFGTRPRLTEPSDTFLRVSTSDLNKPSVRYNTSFQLRRSPVLSAVLTAGAEHYEVSHAGDFTSNATRTTGSYDGDHFPFAVSYANSGLFGQAQIGLKDAVFLTGGLRAERNDKFGDGYGTAWSPRVGAAFLRQFGPVSAKLRASYGNAIKPPQPLQKVAYRDAFSDQLSNPALGPERQKGWDAGVELYLGGTASLAITYYDQSAQDLIDFVLLDGAATPPVFQYQNVGRIQNKGWEVEGGIAVGKLDLRGTYSRVASTVRQLSPTYGGDLRVGDRLLDIPRYSVGARAAYPIGASTNISAEMIHIGGWTGTDWVALFGFFFAGDPYRGSNRDYWMEYPSITKLNAALSHRLAQQLTGFVRVDNIGNNTRFERSNINTQFGRVTTLGVRFHY